MHCVCVLLPSQVEPAGHGEQVVRVVDEPPDVSEPGPHVLQLLAPPALYAVSLPQAVHGPPLGPNVPAPQAVNGSSILRMA